MKSLLTYWHKNLSRLNRREVIAEEKLAKISEVEDWTEERAQLRVKEKIWKKYEDIEDGINPGFRGVRKGGSKDNSGEAICGNIIKK